MRSRSFPRTVQLPELLPAIGATPFRRWGPTSTASGRSRSPISRDAPPRCPAGPVRTGFSNRPSRPPSAQPDLAERPAGEPIVDTSGRAFKRVLIDARPHRSSPGHPEVSVDCRLLAAPFTGAERSVAWNFARGLHSCHRSPKISSSAPGGASGRGFRRHLSDRPTPPAYRSRQVSLSRERAGPVMSAVLKPLIWVIVGAHWADSRPTDSRVPAPGPRRIRTRRRGPAPPGSGPWARSSRGKASWISPFPPASTSSGSGRGSRRVGRWRRMPCWRSWMATTSVQRARDAGGGDQRRQGRAVDRGRQ